MGAICVMALGGSSAHADELYSYSGPHYSSNDCVGSYVGACTSDHVSGSFTTTLSLSQLAGLTSYSVPISDVAGFLFSDGTGLMLSQANATVSDLGISTDNFGDIAWWEVQFTGSNGSFLATSSCLPSTCPGGFTGGLDYSGISAGNSGSTIFEPLGQIWSAPQFVASTPEASGGWLVGTGLMLVALLTFRAVRL